jgi:hypothetical protein
MSRPGPPHNPGLRELIVGKCKWASSLTVEQAKAGFQGWHERGYLPHRDEPELTQMVTFHVADSFPASLRSECEALLEIEDNDERRKQLQAYLDKGRVSARCDSLGSPHLLTAPSAFTTARITSCAPGSSCRTTSTSCLPSVRNRWAR